MDTMEYAPRILSWNLTSRCNLKCPHCYLSAGDAAQRELSTHEALSVVDQASQAGTELLILSGGEPLMRRDLFQIVSCATSRGITVVLGTNGILLAESTVQRLKGAGVQGVGISVDSLDTSKHDAFRGMPRAWDRAVTGLRRCIAAGVPVLVQTTAMPWNYEEIPDLIRFASEEGAAGFVLYFLVCTGRGEALTGITPGQYEQALAFVLAAQDKYPHMMVRARCAPHILRMAQQRGSPLIGSAGCLAGSVYGRIGPEGEVTPCPYLPVQAGNVREVSLENIWANSALLQQMRSPQLAGRCGICEFRRDCGGCRARAYAVSGELWGEDPFCSYKPTNIILETPEIAWDEEALLRLHKIPGFIQERVKRGVEGYARSRGYAEIDVRVMMEVLGAVGRHGHSGYEPGAPGS